MLLVCPLTTHISGKDSLGNQVLRECAHDLRCYVHKLLDPRHIPTLSCGSLPPPSTPPVTLDREQQPLLLFQSLRTRVMWLEGGSASPDPVLATLIPLPGETLANAPSQPTPGSPALCPPHSPPSPQLPFPSSLWTVPLRTVFLPTEVRALPRLEDQS